MNGNLEFEIRRETDLPRLLSWRMLVIRHVFGMQPESIMLKLTSANREYLEKHLRDDTHVSLMASAEGTDIGSGDLCIYDEMPSPDNLTGVCAYIMNIYVSEQYRHNGVASAIVEQLIKEAKRRNAGKIYLETTDTARELYNQMGFKPMKGYMKL